MGSHQGHACAFEVDHLDPGHVGGRIGCEAQGLGFARLIKKVAHLARVAPALAFPLGCDPGDQALLEHVGQFRVLSLGHQSQDRSQLFRLIGRKFDSPVEAARQARIRGDETPHFIGVSGGDHHDAVAVVFHELDQRRDGLMAEILAFARKRVGFVDEEDAVERLLALV